MLVSLIICTRNRADRLHGSLGAIARTIEAAPDVAVEVLLVDNGSTDATAQVIDEWAATVPFPVRKLFEARRGLAHARNRALGCAAGRIVAMTDDDCEPAADYLRSLADSFAGDAAPKVKGGRILLGDPEDLPVTIKDDVREAVYSGFRPGGFIMGANLAFDRAVLERIGPFDVRFGAGTLLKSAEDTDFIFRAYKAGFGVEYDPSIVVSHFHGRRKQSESIDLYRGYFLGDGALYAKHLFSGREVSSWLRDGIWEVVQEWRGRPNHNSPIDKLSTRRLLANLRGMGTYWLRARWQRAQLE